jgi:hypothetical protein
MVGPGGVLSARFFKDLPAQTTVKALIVRKALLPIVANISDWRPKYKGVQQRQLGARVA